MRLLADNYDQLGIAWSAWSPDGTQLAFGKDEGEDSVIAADGSGEAKLIDELTYRSWEGGSYSCEC